MKKQVENLHWQPCFLVEEKQKHKQKHTHTEIEKNNTTNTERDTTQIQHTSYLYIGRKCTAELVTLFRNNKKSN